MKRVLWSTSVVLVLFGVAAFGAIPRSPEKTLQGTILCGRCALKQTKECNTAIVAPKYGGNTTFFFNDRGTDEEYHEAVCGGGRKRGTVVGLILRKEGKWWITPSDVKYDTK